MSLNSMREGKLPEGWRGKPCDIGDGGYVATFRNGSRYAIQFRKGLIIVDVSSDSISLTERFAKYAEAQIQAN